MKFETLSPFWRNLFNQDGGHASSDLSNGCKEHTSLASSPALQTSCRSREYIRCGIFFVFLYLWRQRFHGLWPFCWASVTDDASSINFLHSLLALLCFIQLNERRELPQLSPWFLSGILVIQQTKRYDHGLLLLLLLDQSSWLMTSDLHDTCSMNPFPLPLTV